MDSTSFDLSPPPPPPHHPPTTVPFTLEPADYNNHHHAATTHPPYAEMIYKAIEALKEKDGSSKRAIGKYIEQVYSEVLPPQHNTMLTQHLNHLKSAGLLIMFKKSYKLPSSLPPPPTIPRSHSESHLPFTPITQRGRGRPPKPKPQLNPHPIGPSVNDPAPDVGPTLTVKRGRGRPPGTTRSKSLKRPARPPKPKSVSNGLKRRPGRPPKIQSQPTVIPFAAVPFPSLPQEEPTVGSPRPRGRPKRYADEVVPSTGAASALSVVNAPAMRRGRPPKLAVVGKPNNSTGRPVGRPKGAKAAKKFADEDLRRKFEYFQSKVKESLEVLKPYFYNESPVTAIAAIQELEMLTTLNLEAPLRDETLPLQQFPEQIPPQLPQTQMYEQQYLQIPSQSQVQQLFQPHTLDLS